VYEREDGEEHLVYVEYTYTHTHTFLGFENSTCVCKKPAVVNMK